MIDKCEARLAELEQLISEPDFYQQEQARIDSTLKEVADKQAELDQAMERWSELEG